MGTLNRPRAFGWCGGNPWSLVSVNLQGFAENAFVVATLFYCRITFLRLSSPCLRLHHMTCYHRWNHLHLQTHKRSLIEGKSTIWAVFHLRTKTHPLTPDMLSSSEPLCPRHASGNGFRKAKLSRSNGAPWIRLYKITHFLNPYAAYYCRLVDTLPVTPVVLE